MDRWRRADAYYDICFDLATTMTVAERASVWLLNKVPDSSCLHCRRPYARVYPVQALTLHADLRGVIAPSSFRLVCCRLARASLACHSWCRVPSWPGCELWGPGTRGFAALAAAG